MDFNKINDKLLIKIIFYGLLTVSILLLIGHFYDKNHKYFTSKSSTPDYIESREIVGDKKELMLNSTNEADFTQQENSVAYRTTVMQKQASLSGDIQKIINIHFDVISSDPFTQEKLNSVNDELSIIHENFTSLIKEVGDISPPSGQEKSHNELLESIADAILTLEDYQSDLNEGKVVGTSTNPHIAKLKAVFSKN